MPFPLAPNSALGRTGAWDRSVAVEEVLRLDACVHASAATWRRHRAAAAKERARHEKEVARQVSGDGVASSLPAAPLLIDHSYRLQTKETNKQRHLVAALGRSPSFWSP